MKNLIAMSSVTIAPLLGLALLHVNSVSANEDVLSGGAVSPEAVEYNYILEEVREKGAKGDDLREYERQCNDNGICSYTTKSAVEERSVVYHTPFGSQEVVYSSQQLD